MFGLPVCSGSHHVEAIAIQDATQGDIDTFIAELLERPEYADDATLDAIKELDSAMKDVDAHLDNWEGYMSFVQVSIVTRHISYRPG